MDGRVDGWVRRVTHIILDGDHRVKKCSNIFQNQDIMQNQYTFLYMAIWKKKKLTPTRTPSLQTGITTFYLFTGSYHANMQPNREGGGNLSLRPPHTCFPSPIPAARVSTKLSDYKNKGLAILPSVSWDCLGSLDPGISAVSCWTRGGGGGGTVGNNALFHNWGIRNTNEGAWSKKKKKLG